MKYIFIFLASFFLSSGMTMCGSGTQLVRRSPLMPDEIICHPSKVAVLGARTVVNNSDVVIMGSTIHCVVNSTMNLPTQPSVFQQMQPLFSDPLISSFIVGEILRYVAFPALDRLKTYLDLNNNFDLRILQSTLSLNRKNLNKNIDETTKLEKNIDMLDQEITEQAKTTYHLASLAFTAPLVKAHENAQSRLDALKAKRLLAENKADSLIANRQALADELRKALARE